MPVSEKTIETLGIDHVEHCLGERHDCICHRIEQAREVGNTLLEKCYREIAEARLKREALLAEC